MTVSYAAPSTESIVIVSSCEVVGAELKWTVTFLSLNGFPIAVDLLIAAAHVAEVVVTNF